MIDRKHYEVQATFTNGETKTYEIDYEIPRIKGEYVLVDGMYVNKPDVTEGFAKEKTRYLYLNSEEKLVPGNWLTGEEPTNWFNYKNKNWANIYVESEGTGSYYVWIPRYCYKIDQENSVTGNERMDVKFINTYNEYIDGETGEMTEWNELEEQGYKIPEAFGWDDTEAIGFPTIIPGYWMSKYQMSDLGNEYIVDYLMTASQYGINVKNIKTSTSKEVAKCTYAINGKIEHESQTLENYTLRNLSEGTNTVNVTLLDKDNSIIGSMTKQIIPVTVNEPDLSTGFNKEETYYVYYDANDNEIIGNKISGQPPANWYNYTYSQWANIVITDGTVENGKITGETYKNYFVWIPRYAYMLDGTSQKSNVLFLEGTSSDVPTGYKIPEAFKWGDNLEHDLTGYWISKYQLTQ